MLLIEEYVLKKGERTITKYSNNKGFSGNSYSGDKHPPKKQICFSKNGCISTGMAALIYIPFSIRKAIKCIAIHIS